MPNPLPLWNPITKKSWNGLKLLTRSWTRKDLAKGLGCLMRLPDAPARPAWTYQSSSTPLTSTRFRWKKKCAYPGDRAMERRIKSLIRWNAMAMVHRQNKKDPGIGGHISTYSSLATLLEVGYNHFFPCHIWRSSPATLFISRAMPHPAFMHAHFWKAASAQEQVENYRHELRDTPGLSSYPHPWLMPNFWRFPTVSMGLGPAECDLSGTLHALSGEPRTDQGDAAQGLGVRRRRRNGRTRSPGLAAHAGFAREARQPDLRGELQPAAPGRPGARQWQDHQ